MVLFWDDFKLWNRYKFSTPNCKSSWTRFTSVVFAQSMDSSSLISSKDFTVSQQLKFMLEYAE